MACDSTQSIDGLLKKTRYQDGIILKLSGQVEKRKQELIIATKKAEDESRKLIEELELKTGQVSNLENEISNLKQVIRGADGKNCLLRYRLQKTQNNALDQNQNDFASSVVYRQDYLLHHSKLELVLNEITRNPASLRTSGDDDQTIVNSALTAQSTNKSQPLDAHSIKLSDNIISEEPISVVGMCSEEDLKEKLLIQLRINERLKEQIRTWVDKQIELHCFLAEQEVRTGKIRKDFICQEHKSDEASKYCQTPAIGSMKQNENQSSHSSLVYQSLSSNTTSPSSLGSPDAESSLKNNSVSFTSPRQLKELFSGLDVSKNILNPSIAKLSVNQESVDESIHSIVINEPLTYPIDNESIVCGNIVLEFQDVDDNDPVISKIHTTDKLSEFHYDIKSANHMMSPSVSAVTATTSPKTFQNHLDRYRNENNFIKEDISRFQSYLQILKSSEPRYVETTRIESRHRLNVA